MQGTKIAQTVLLGKFRIDSSLHSQEFHSLDLFLPG